MERKRGEWEWKGRLENEKAKDDSREGGGGRRAGMEGIETREKELGTGRGSGLGLYSLGYIVRGMGVDGTGIGKGTLGKDRRGDLSRDGRGEEERKRRTERGGKRRELRSGEGHRKGRGWKG